MLIQITLDFLHLLPVASSLERMALSIDGNSMFKRTNDSVEVQIAPGILVVIVKHAEKALLIFH